MVFPVLVRYPVYASLVGYTYRYIARFSYRAHTYTAVRGSTADLGGDHPFYGFRV